MAETLTVHLNRDGINSVAAPAAVESDDSLVVVLRNHGEPSHVHLRLDGELAGVASLGGTNIYVEDARRVVDLSLPRDAEWPVNGSLEAVTGHGQQRSRVDVTLSGPAGDETDGDEAVGEESADVDVATDDDGPTVTARSATANAGALDRWGPTLRAAVPLLLLAALAVVLAFVALEVGGDSAVLGVLAVVAGLAVAGYFLARG